jgi:hypothetical protein
MLSGNLTKIDIEEENTANRSRGSRIFDFTFNFVVLAGSGSTDLLCNSIGLE